MKPISPETSKGRTVSIDDVHHNTADQPKSDRKASAKALRHAARQGYRQDIKSAQSNYENNEK